MGHELTPPEAGRASRRLAAASVLAVSAFAVLALIPFPLTGPIGAALGDAIWRALGIFAPILPCLGIGFGWEGWRSGTWPPVGGGVRVGVVGLSAPVLLALVAGPNPDLYLAPIAEWSSLARATGWLPGALAAGLMATIGVGGGAVLVGLLIAIAWYLTRSSLGASATVPGRLTRKPVARSVVVHRSAPPAPAAPMRATPAATREDLPALSLLDAAPTHHVRADHDALRALGEQLLVTLRTFKADGTLAGITSGPTVSQFEVLPATGVKVARLLALADDLAISMRSTSLRVTPLPGRGAVGIEIPSPTPRMVTLREVLESAPWHDAQGVLPIALGVDVAGHPIVVDLGKMPHLLVAGATGSGKSVAINTIITSLLYRYTPTELRFLMVDPKMVELSMYAGLPHLRHPVVTDPNDAAKVLTWAVHEMNRRYQLLQRNGARQLSDFNRKVRDGVPLKGLPTEDGDVPYTEGPLPFIVVVVDELADLMMTVGSDIERPLALLAQKARAIGLHLILATQRPSVNVLTGLIKANFPARMAFRVASKVDSRTILDHNGAEALLGNGDMLLTTAGAEPERLQGAYLSTQESERLMTWYTAQANTPREEEDILQVADRLADNTDPDERPVGGTRDALFVAAALACVQNEGGSTSLLQRKLGIGYGRAARLMDQMEEAGILGPTRGSKPRDVLVSLSDIESLER